MPRTKIMVAAERGDPGSLTKALEAGASPSERDDHERTPLHQAMYMHGTGEVVGMLVKAGAPVDALDKDQTPCTARRMRMRPSSRYAESGTDHWEAALGSSGNALQRSRQGWEDGSACCNLPTTKCNNLLAKWLAEYRADVTLRMVSFRVLVDGGCKTAPGAYDNSAKVLEQPLTPAAAA